MAKNKGYVSIWRDIQDNPIWTAEKFSKGQAWVDLILMANHEEKTFILGNDVIKAEVGSVITSELKLMDRWKWSKAKVRNYLTLLEKSEMIQRRPDRKKTIIIIRNYTTYQTTTKTAMNAVGMGESGERQTDKETTKRPQKDHEETTNRTQTITTNNYTITKNKGEDNHEETDKGYSRFI